LRCRVTSRRRADGRATTEFQHGATLADVTRTITMRTMTELDAEARMVGVGLFSGIGAADACLPEALSNGRLAETERGKRLVRSRADGVWTRRGGCAAARMEPGIIRRRAHALPRREQGCSEGDPDNATGAYAPLDSPISRHEELAPAFCLFGLENARRTNRLI